MVNFRKFEMKPESYIRNCEYRIMEAEDEKWVLGMPFLRSCEEIIEQDHDPTWEQSIAQRKKEETQDRKLVYLIILMVLIALYMANYWCRKFYHRVQRCRHGPSYSPDDSDSETDSAKYGSEEFEDIYERGLSDDSEESFGRVTDGRFHKKIPY